VVGKSGKKKCKKKNDFYKKSFTKPPFYGDAVPSPPSLQIEKE